MNARYAPVLLLGAVLVAPCAGAQFLGDALASAGINVSERDAGEALIAAGVINDSSLTLAPSTAPTPAPVYTPDTIGKDVGVKPRGASGSSAPSPAPSSQPSSPAPASSSTGSPAPMAGGATAFSGVNAHAAAIDPKAAAAWHDAFRPIGTKLTKPPEGAITMEKGGNSYTYVKGMFLQQKGGSWEVVAAPVGAVIGEKPVGAATVFAGGKPYTYYAGTFFVYDGTQKGYVVVQPPLGATVDYLPEAAAKVQWSGSVHYRYAGTHYKPFYRGSSVVYTVAGS